MAFCRLRGVWAGRLLRLGDWGKGLGKCIGPGHQWLYGVGCLDGCFCLDGLCVHFRIDRLGSALIGLGFRLAVQVLSLCFDGDTLYGYLNLALCIFLLQFGRWGPYVWRLLFLCGQFTL